MNFSRSTLALFALPALTSSLFCPAQKPAGTYDSIARGRAHDMLRQTYREVKSNYYDPKFHGIDLDARFKEYDEKLDSAKSQGEAFRDIAAFLEGFHDSHLFFAPPPRPYRYASGYTSQVIGNNVYVTHVRPGTDAAEKLQPGDHIVHIDGYDANRTDFHDLEYYLHVLAPAPSVNLDYLNLKGEPMHTTVDSKMTPRPLTADLYSNDVYQLIRDEESDSDLSRDRSAEADDVFIWKMAVFSDPPAAVDEMFRKARKHKALVLDLRGNPGGRIDTLKSVLGHLFNHDIKIGDEVMRKETRPMLAKTAGSDAYTGTLFVLIDARSASCSELLARVVQLEHRGTILGDLSAGAVMESIQYPESVGVDVMVAYGLSITHANIIMTDGKSLEDEGVMPEARILPVQRDLAEGRDPALSYAIALAGGKCDPAAAGKLFPFEWPKL
jgi:C-terminal processing protease CtpA/Prc